jgi:hypothetical protein
MFRSPWKIVVLPDGRNRTLVCAGWAPGLYQHTSTDRGVKCKSNSNVIARLDPKSGLPDFGTYK